MDGTPKVGARDAFVTKYRYTGVRQWTRQQGASGATTEGYDVAVDTADNAFLVGTATAGLDGNAQTGPKDVFVTKYDAAGTKQWTRQMGAAGQNTMGRRAATDAAGNVYVSGWTYGGLDGNPLMGAQDLFVIKYNAAGTKQWTRQFGAAGNNAWLYGAATDAAGNLYLTGQSGGGLDGNPNPTTGGDAYLIKYDPSGNRLWTREFSSAHGIWASGIFIDDTGIYVSGGSPGDVGNLANTTLGKAHNYVAKFDTAGNRLWVVQQNPAVTAAGALAPVYSNGVNRDFNNRLYLGGYVEGNFDGNVLVGQYDAFVTKLAAP
nr:SBBP repeat-containing protein [Corallococcus soli]